MEKKTIDPFVKWPGGKRWLVKKYNYIFSCEYKRLIEPFLGSAAVFFHLSPNKALLSDINSDLINVYRVMRDDHKSLSKYLYIHQRKHSEDYYYQIRSQVYNDPVQAAARFLYLNRTCFNGMYRVNSQGHFNVPIGTKNNCIYDIERFADYSRLLKNAELKTCDFSIQVEKAQEGDLIFADPPYLFSKSQNGFIKYNESLFSWEDQTRLCDCLSSARERGALIISMNADNEKIEKMYHDKGFFTKKLERNSTIAGKAEKRKRQTELLIMSNCINGGGTY